MPYKTDKLAINDPYLDKRVKILPFEREEIIELHKQGASIHHLAKSYEVSRRLIQFIVDPARKERDLQLRKDRGGSKVYYKKEKHAIAMRRHRKHKREVLAHRIS